MSSNVQQPIAFQPVKEPVGSKDTRQGQSPAVDGED